LDELTGGSGEEAYGPAGVGSRSRRAAQRYVAVHAFVSLRLHSSTPVRGNGKHERFAWFLAADQDLPNGNQSGVSRLADLGVSVLLLLTGCLLLAIVAGTINAGRS